MPETNQQDHGNALDINLIIDNAAEIIAAVALGVLVWRTYLYQREIRNRDREENRKYYTERYTRGLDYLRHENLNQHEVGAGILRNLAKSDIAGHEQLLDIAGVLHKYCIRYTDYFNIDDQDQILKNAMEEAIWTISEIDNIISVDKKMIGFSRINLSGLYFFGIELEGFYFLDSNLSNMCFNSHVTDTNFKCCRLVNIDFSGSNFSGTHFYLADLSGSSFNGCNMESVSLMDANVGCCDFSGADFSANPFYETANSKLIIYDKDNPPTVDGNTIEDLPISRAYVYPITKAEMSGHLPGTPVPSRTRKFVNSEEAWSGKNVDEWIKKEIPNLYFPLHDNAEE